jgi:hypothetical protein
MLLEQRFANKKKFRALIFDSFDQAKEWQRPQFFLILPIQTSFKLILNSN